MCILFIAVKQHVRYPLIIAANRDEFFKRPTDNSHFWPTTPNILAGIDLQASGTWMGINTQGHIAALTNIRAPGNLKADAISRGLLVKNYLQNPNEFLVSEMQSTRNLYNGYNLLFGPWDNLQVYNNHHNQLNTLNKGIYGLSNANLNSPWPKINKGVASLSQYCQNATEIKDEDIFTILLDSTQAQDAELPQTGVSLEWERKLSSIFVHSKDYGTRSSTVLKVDDNNHVTWAERTFERDTTCISAQKFEFDII